MPSTKVIVSVNKTVEEHLCFVLHPPYKQMHDGTKVQGAADDHGGIYKLFRNYYSPRGVSQFPLLYSLGGSRA